ncbi:anti-anti-sigma factor [Xenococcus sp. PCC 7305]|uniref:STAS domain-containing protein n=1 Tax=Xenococcus sp. PCC 7305 TaxID=102125 RepID=UPI0002ACBBCB|nr:STAS domain-containing protein [Xenococcus sp. PCC 7305]ELS05411.1 anti-anti-sigma factor [Xenococcus sp. PCC 7305]
MTKKVEVMQPSGIVDGIVGNQIREQAIDFVSKGTDIILVDCQEITFMNSAGIGALVAALKAVSNSGGELHICSLNDQVQIIFSMTKMNLIFQVFGSREEWKEQVKLTNQESGSRSLN